VGPKPQRKDKDKHSSQSSLMGCQSAPTQSTSLTNLLARQDMMAKSMTLWICICAKWHRTNKMQVTLLAAWTKTTAVTDWCCIVLWWPAMLDGLLNVSGNNAFNIKVHTSLKLDLSTMPSFTTHQETVCVGHYAASRGNSHSTKPCIITQTAAIVWATMSLACSHRFAQTVAAMVYC